ncbi:MAG: dynamin family protein [Actinomycetia bacterium]|nr:dynamin family protein [Actinomycetes bacterium]
MAEAAQLVVALTRLRDTLALVRLPLPLPDAKERSVQAASSAGQLGDYILPRLVNLDAPMLAVVGGSTGAGKSTLVNSLIGRPVSAPGVIRPTTRAPVLVYNPADEHWFADDRVLPGLVRTRTTSISPSSLQLISEPTLPPGLALLDAPDIDSVVDANRHLAAQLLQAADMWLFTTSAARYSDAVPWEFLRAAAGRQAGVAIVLDRVPPAALEAVPADLKRLMHEAGLDAAPLFVVPESAVDREGLLGDAVIAPVRSWLAGLASDSARRQLVVLRTLDGAISALLATSELVADAALQQIEALASLQEDAALAYRDAQKRVAEQSGDGTLLRGEVLSRWHDYVGTSEFVKRIDQGVAWMRDKVTGLFRAHAEEPVDGGQDAARAGLEALLAEAGQAAAERAGQAWQANPVGRTLMADHPELARASAGYPEGVQRLIRAWQNDVLELVADEGEGKRLTARIAATGVNAVGAALTLVIFANTGGLTGAELGVAGGTTVVAQRLLESIFGGEAVRRLAKTAKGALDARVEGLLATELSRFTVVGESLQVSDRLPDELTDAIGDVRTARAAAPVLGAGSPPSSGSKTRVSDGSWYADGDAAGVHYTQTIPIPPPAPPPAPDEAPAATDQGREPGQGVMG